MSVHILHFIYDFRYCFCTGYDIRFTIESVSNSVKKINHRQRLYCIVKADKQIAPRSIDNWTTSSSNSGGSIQYLSCKCVDPLPLQTKPLN
jgi:hypothetical protein